MEFFFLLALLGTTGVLLFAAEAVFSLLSGTDGFTICNKFPLLALQRHLAAKERRESGLKRQMGGAGVKKEGAEEGMARDVYVS